MSQQAAEKALKVVLKHFDENTFGHDLRELVARPEGYSRVSKEVRRPRGALSNRFHDFEAEGAIEYPPSPRARGLENPF